MERRKPWVPGSSIAVRSVHPDHVGYTMGMLVIADEEDAIAVHQAPGAICKLRSGPRGGGPRGRSLLPGGWDGGYADRIWRGSNVRVHHVEHGYSVIRGLDRTTREFAGWYVNLEAPWRRTTVGFDTRDLTLDVTVADDLSAWAWKDEDELEWAARIGEVDNAFVEEAYAQGRRAISDLEAGAWPFNADWSRWLPDMRWPAPTDLPAAWSKL